MKNYKLIVIFTIFITLSSCTNWWEENIKWVQEISQQEILDAKNNLWVVSNLKTVWADVFKQEIAKWDWVLLDLRTPWEVAQWVIGWWAINIDFYDSDFKEALKKLKRENKYLIYCRSGARSGKTLKIMKELWFTNVLNLGWWINSWLSSWGVSEDFKEKNLVSSMSTKIITISAKKWEFKQKEIRVKQWENILLKIENTDVLHGISIPAMKIVEDKEIKLDTSKKWEFEFVCANYCGEKHREMKGKIIIE